MAVDTRGHVDGSAGFNGALATDKEGGFTYDEALVQAFLADAIAAKSEEAAANPNAHDATRQIADLGQHSRFLTDVIGGAAAGAAAIAAAESARDSSDKEEDHRKRMAELGEELKAEQEQAQKNYRAKHGGIFSLGTALSAQELEAITREKMDEGQQEKSKNFDEENAHLSDAQRDIDHVFARSLNAGDVAEQFNDDIQSLREQIESGPYSDEQREVLLEKLDTIEQEAATMSENFANGGQAAIFTSAIDTALQDGRLSPELIEALGGENLESPYELVQVERNGEAMLTIKSATSGEVIDGAFVQDVRDRYGVENATDIDIATIEDARERHDIAMAQMVETIADDVEQRSLHSAKSTTERVADSIGRLTEAADPERSAEEMRASDTSIYGAEEHENIAQERAKIESSSCTLSPEEIAARDHNSAIDPHAVMLARFEYLGVDPSVMAPEHVLTIVENGEQLESYKEYMRSKGVLTPELESQILTRSEELELEGKGLVAAHEVREDPSDKVKELMESLEENPQTGFQITDAAAGLRHWTLGAPAEHALSEFPSVPDSAARNPDMAASRAESAATIAG